MTTRRVVVIGGGVSGLASACLLAREGHQVTLLERSGELGGRAGVWRHDGFTFDTGPSWYLMPEVFEHFYRLMGTSTSEQFELASLHPAYRVFPEPDGAGSSEALDVRSGPESAAALFEQVEPGAGRRLRRYLRSASRAYHAAVQSFLYNPFTSWSGILSRRVLAATPAVLPLLTRSLWSFIARRFSDTRLRQILGYPAVFLGTSPFDAPALYHLMSHLDLVDGVQYPLGGFARFVDSLVDLAQANGVEVRTHADVRSIITDGGEVRAVEYLHDGDIRRETADLVVSAIDEHHTETALLAPADRSYPVSRWRKQVTGPSAVLIMLGVEGALPQLPHHSLFFTHDWAENFDAIFGARPRVPNPASLYVCKPSATDDVAPSGHEALFVLVPVPAEPSLGHGGVGGVSSERVTDIAESAVAQIAAWANIPDLAGRVVLQKTVGPADFEEQYNSFRGSALGPAHTLRQSAFLRGVTVSRRVRGLYYAGATTVPGVGLPMCLISAELVLKHVRGDTSPCPWRSRDLHLCRLPAREHRVHRADRLAISARALAVAGQSSTHDRYRRCLLHRVGRGRHCPRSVPPHRLALGDGRPSRSGFSSRRGSLSRVPQLSHPRAAPRQRAPARSSGAAVTYALMSIPFAVVAVTLFALGGVHAHRARCGMSYIASWGITLIVLVVLTIVFDNLMMAAGFFDYGSSQISGIRIALIPIEDLLYPVAGSLLIAGLHSMLSPKRSHDASNV